MISGCVASLRKYAAQTSVVRTVIWINALSVNESFPSVVSNKESRLPGDNDHQCIVTDNNNSEGLPRAPDVRACFDCSGRRNRPNVMLKYTITARLGAPKALTIFTRTPLPATSVINMQLVRGAWI